MKFTIRELLLMVSYAGVALTALRLGGVFASVVVLLFSIVTLGVAIIAFVGREQGKVFAIGYLVASVLYGGVHFASGSNELEPYSGRLATTRIIRPLFEAMAVGTWVDSETGEEIPNYDPSADPARYGGGGMSSGASMVTYKEAVDRSTFMTVAHMLFAALFGWLGGKFALYVHYSPKKSADT